MHTSVFSNLLRFRTAVAAAAVLTSTLAFSGCTKQQLANAGASYLIIDAVTAAAGPSTTFGGSLASDVETNGTRWTDNGRVSLRLAMSDPGTVESPSTPTSANYITVTRYHVVYKRADGLSVQGLHVPFEFDGAATITVKDIEGVVILPVTLVHAHAKFDAPLKDLVTGGNAIATVAEITVFGTDQAGRVVTVTGAINVTFANWN